MAKKPIYRLRSQALSLHPLPFEVLLKEEWLSFEEDYSDEDMFDRLEAFVTFFRVRNPKLSKDTKLVPTAHIPSDGSGLILRIWREETTTEVKARLTRAKALQ